jgi:hypothetical protein
MNTEMQIKHVFVHGIRADTDLQYRVRDTQKFQNLPLQQSTIDGICGLCCVLHASMILLGLTRWSVENIARAKRGHLRKLWKMAGDSYFTGTDEDEIAEYVSAFSPKLTSEILITTRAAKIGRTVAAAIDAGHVAIASFDTKTSSHWTTVTGYEMSSEEATPRALLCLDSDAPRPWTSFHNSRIELRRHGDGSARFRAPYLYACRYYDGELYAARMLSVVVVKRATPKRARPP